jgi:hypothetical protein
VGIEVGSRFLQQRAATPVAVLTRHPGLLIEAVSLWMALGGWSKAAAEYRRWRLHTAYGGDNPRLMESDLVHFLRWRRQMRRLRRWDGAE